VDTAISYHALAVAGTNPVTIYASAGTYSAIYVYKGDPVGGFSLSTYDQTPANYYYGIAVNQANTHVYCSDLSGFMADFTTAFSAPTTWSDLVPGAASGLAVDGSGNIYTAENNTDDVYKFDASGAPVTHWGGYSGLADVAVDNTGTLLYAASAFDSKVIKSGLDGSGQTTFATLPNVYGSGDPHGVCVDGSGNVFVTDRSNAYLYKYDSSGTLLAAINVNLITPGIQIYPGSIGVDGNGYLYVVDEAGGRILIFAPH
jgi:sugar lactone lactonase YvrE